VARSHLLAEAFPEAVIHAVDFSYSALTIAQQNAQALCFADQIIFIRVPGGNRWNSSKAR
jgi:methylase of polypeptide subunit release factors